MRTRKLRLLSALLAVAMMFMLMPTAAFADAGLTSGGTQTEEVSVSITGFETGKLAEAVKAKAAEQNTTIDKITTLTISGGTLNKTDFEVLSGVQVEGDGVSALDAKIIEDKTSYLSSLKKLDLGNATCENNTIPARAFCRYDTATSAPDTTESIESIVLPNTLEVIGLGAFSNMANLSYVGTKTNGTANDEIDFPTSLTTIGFCAFYNDKNLKGTVKLPQGNFNLGSAAFTYSGITGKVEIGNNVTFMASPKMDEGVHLNTFSRTDISAIEFASTEIPKGFAANDYSLTSIKIADTVTKIGNQAFRKNDPNKAGGEPIENTIENPIVIPKSVTEIGESAFARIGKVNSIIVQGTGVTYGKWAFHGLGEINNVAAKVYVAKYDAAADDSIWENSTVHLYMDGGHIPTDADGNVTVQADATTGLYSPEKEGYTFNGWYTNVNDENTKLTTAPTKGTLYTAKWTQNTTGDPALTTDMDNKNFTVGDETEFSFTTLVPGGTTDTSNATIVKAFASFDEPTNASEGIEKLEYWETAKNPQDWETFKDISNGVTFGPETGFPLMNNYTSRFKVTFKKAGDYTFTVKMKKMGTTPTEDVACDKTVTIHVNPRTQKITLPGGEVNVTVNGENVTNQVQGNYLNVSIDDLDEGAAVALTVKNPKYGDTYQWTATEGTGTDTADWTNVEGATTSEGGKTYTFKVTDKDVKVELATEEHPYAVGDFTVKGLGEYTYSGKAVEVTVTPKDETITDYAVKYLDADGNEVQEMKEVGTYTVVIESRGETLEAGKVIIKPVEEPAPEEKTAKLTFTDDCTAELEDGTPIESGKQVKVGEKVTLKLVESKVPEGMKFDAYVIDPIPADGKLTANGTTVTFEMTEKDTSVKVNFVTADTEDSGWDAATIVTGVAIGAGTAALAYHIGTEVYAEQILGKGVAIPRTRADVALTAWQLAGKPEVAIEGEPLSEAAMAQKWAVESGLMQNDADGSFNPDKKMSKIKALKVLDAAKKM